MKIGALHVTWKRSWQQDLVNTEVKRLIGTDELVRMGVARLARSEVKNYLAELAEEAEMPFGNPAAFLRLMNDYLARTASVNLQRDPDDPYDPIQDAPYEVIEETMPDIGAGTCSCRELKEAGHEVHHNQD